MRYLDHSSCSLGYGHEAHGGMISSSLREIYDVPIQIVDNIGRIKYHRVTSPRITVWTSPGKTSQYSAMILFSFHNFYY